MLSRLFMKMIITVPTLAFLVSVNPSYTYVELMDELCEWDSSEDIATACGRAEEIFGEQPHDTYQLLRERAIELGNFRVEEYMIDKIAETANSVGKPDRVHNRLAQYMQFREKLPTQEELDLLAENQDEEVISREISDTEAIDMLTAGLEQIGITVEEIDLAKKLLEEQFRQGRKDELLAPVLHSQGQQALGNDRLLFWIYGPANPLVNQDLTVDTPSAKYGGCRMLLCDVFDYNEEDDYVEDWFLGHCEECLLKIPFRHWAVRMPREHGGWVGCYCSWKCVMDRADFIEQDRAEPNPLLADMITAFEKKTEEVGIQDRM